MLCFDEKIVAWKMHAFALNRLDDQRGDLPRRERRIERGKITELHAFAAFKIRSETFLEMHISHHGQRTHAQPVKRAFNRNQARASSRSARKFDRAFHRL